MAWYRFFKFCTFRQHLVIWWAGWLKALPKGLITHVWWCLSAFPRRGSPLLLTQSFSLRGLVSLGTSSDSKETESVMSNLMFSFISWLPVTLLQWALKNSSPFLESFTSRCCAKFKMSYGFLAFLAFLCELVPPVPPWYYKKNPKHCYSFFFSVLFY